MAAGVGEASPHSFVHELEPSDSERVTEVPSSDEMLMPPDLKSAPRSPDIGLETIPAPAPGEEEPPAGRR